MRPQACPRCIEHRQYMEGRRSEEANIHRHHGHRGCGHGAGCGRCDRISATPGGRLACHHGRADSAGPAVHSCPLVCTWPPRWPSRRVGRDGGGGLCCRPLNRQRGERHAALVVVNVAVGRAPPLYGSVPPRPTSTRAAGAVCRPTRTAGAAGEGEEAGAVGTLPAHALRPGSWGQHSALRAASPTFSTIQ
jgi:hypothetical protein